jgi:putative hemolysin
MGSLSSNNNEVLVDNCQNLRNLTVTLNVARDLITLGDTGFSLQLNCYPQPTSKSQGQTLNWFQYVIYVGGPVNNQIGCEIQYWSVGAPSYAPGQPWPPGYTPNPPNTTPWLPVLPNDDRIQTFGSVPSNVITSGTEMQIQLATDSDGNVASAQFIVTGATDSRWTFAFPAGALYPIYGFQLNVVGPGGGSSCWFTSGAGTLMYSVTEGALAVQGASTNCGGPQPPTGESSNVAYGDVTPASGATVSQSLYATTAAEYLWAVFISQDSSNRILVSALAGSNWYGTYPINQTSKFSPAVAYFGEKAYVAFNSNDPSNRILLSSTPSGVWTNAATYINQTSKWAPALAVFNNQLFCAFAANDTTNRVLVCSSPDGSTWSTNAVATGQTTQSGPALAVFNNRLYCAFLSNDASNTIILTSSLDGKTWSPRGLSINQTSKFTPSLGVFNNRLYCAFTSDDPTNRILLCSSPDGTTWPTTTTFINQTSQAAPTLAVFNNQLYCAFMSNDSSDSVLVCSSPDGNTWSTTTTFINQTSQFGPALLATPLPP